MSIFQWTWAVKGAPSFVNTSPSKQHLCNYLYPWLLLTGGLRALSRGGRAWLSWQLCERVDPQKKAARESVFPTCPSAFLSRLLGMQSPPPAGCSGSHLLFLFCPCRFAASSVPQPRANREIALTCPQTWPFFLSESPATSASKPNTAYNYLKTALWFHHPFIHLGHKNNTLFYLWV